MRNINFLYCFQSVMSLPSLSQFGHKPIEQPPLSFSDAIIALRTAESWHKLIEIIDRLRPDDLHQVVSWIIQTDQWGLLISIMGAINDNATVQGMSGGAINDNIMLFQSIYKELRNNDKTEAFGVAIKGQSSTYPTRYAILSGDLEIFKVVYPDPNGIRITIIEELEKLIIKYPQVRPILEYALSAFDIGNKQKICLQDIILPVIRRTEEVFIPINYIIKDIAHTIRKDEIPLEQSATTIHFSVDYDNLGNGVKGFLEDYKGLESDPMFFQRNREFLSRLSKRELIILSGYTHQGDQLTNLFLRKDPELKQYVEKILSGRKKGSIPIHYQLLDRLPSIEQTEKGLKNWLVDNAGTTQLYALVYESIEQYVRELKDIFAKAPELKKETVVYRGTKTFYYKREGSDIFTNIDFISTSFNPMIGINFTENDCCFTQFRLKGNTRAIFIEPVSQHPDEFELLIPPGHNFKILKNRIKKYNEIDPARTSYKSLFCYNTSRLLRHTLMANV